MTLSIETSSPSHINKESPLSMTTLPPPIISPSSDLRFWSVLHDRVESLLESRKSQLPSSASTTNDVDSSRVKRLKQDSMLLIMGFDSIASTLSQLTNNLDNALQGTRDLAKPMTEIAHVNSTNSKKSEDEESEKGEDDAHVNSTNSKKLEDEVSEKGEDDGEEKKGVKRKLDECCSDDQVENENKEKLQAEKNLKRVKNLAVSMATKSALLARKLNSVKSDMCFLQERCALLEEENRRFRDGFEQGIRPDEDDLVRLQLEALLAEKSKLATENANLTRENQCLRQLVEYHQFASEDLSASYEQVIEGLCLDFSSPGTEDQENGRNNPMTPRTGVFEFHTPLHKNLDKEEGFLNH